MSRKAREKSPTGIYHVLVTGIDRRELFADDEDRAKYVSLLSEYQGVCGCNVYAYCLMPNHIHLLVNERGGDISRIMKRIGTSYVYWYNNKHDRTGQLFEDRFKSESVLNEEGFKRTLRFIHMNPVKERLASGPEEYAWSSFSGYFTRPEVSPDMARRVFGGTVEFIAYHAKQAEDACLELTRREKKLTDEALARLIEREYGCSATALNDLDQEEELKIIVQLMKSYNIPVRQLARVTDTSLTTIWRTVTKALVGDEAAAGKSPLK